MKVNSLIDLFKTSLILAMIAFFSSPSTAQDLSHRYKGGSGDGYSIAFINFVTSIEQNANIPDQIKLHQNYPNPFNPSTVIRFQLPENSRVELRVFDLLGREVAEVMNEFKPAGTHSVTFQADGLSSGVYIYRLEAGDIILTKKLILIK